MPLPAPTISPNDQMTKRPPQLALRVMLPRPDPFLNGVYLDRTSVDFGFAAAGGGGETVTLTNNSNTKVLALYTSNFVVNTVFPSRGRERETESEKESPSDGHIYCSRSLVDFSGSGGPRATPSPLLVVIKLRFMLFAVLTSLSLVSAVDVRVHPGSMRG